RAIGCESPNSSAEGRSPALRVLPHVSARSGPPGRCHARRSERIDRRRRRASVEDPLRPRARRARERSGRGARTSSRRGRRHRDLPAAGGRQAILGLPTAERDVAREQAHRVPREPPLERDDLVDREESLEQLPQRIVGEVLTGGGVAVEALAAPHAPAPVERIDERDNTDGGAPRPAETRDSVPAEQLTVRHAGCMCWPSAPSPRAAVHQRRGWREASRGGWARVWLPASPQRAASLARNLPR